MKLTEENLINWIKLVSPVEIKLPPKHYLVSKVQPGIAGKVRPLEVLNTPLNILSSVSTWMVYYESNSVKILFDCIDVDFFSKKTDDKNSLYFREYKTFTIQELD
jgi:hypothetical protein